ncbi:MAG: dienelactone hydrolase family protein [Desulfobacteraceae bacterium]|jgi:dienelactone hydrolase
MAWVRMALSVVVLMVLLACASLRSQEALRFTALESPSKQLSGTLTLPRNNKGPVPIVVLVHGTAGVDSRYAFHKPALLEAGIGTLEVDFKTNVFTSGSDRPPISTFQPWAFGALKALRAHPLVDANRIAIMGFSLGGHLSVSVASKNVVERWLGPDQPGFAAHVGFYPACQWLEKYFDASGVTGAPILILAGELDAWGDGETCPDFAVWLNESQSGIVSLTIYPNVHHGFDREGSWQGYAPYARNRTGILQWDAKAAYDSRERAVTFLRQAFNM